MLKIKQTVVHNEVTNETIIELETRIVARHVFRIDDEMDSEAVERQTNIAAKILVDDVIDQANGFEFTPLESRLTFNYLGESDV